MKMMLAETENPNDVICHQMKIRIGSEFYKVIICGNRYQAEKYLREELKADEIEWVRTFVMEKNIAFDYSKKNRTIAQDTFFIRMEFICQYGATHANPLKEQKEGN